MYIQIGTLNFHALFSREKTIAVHEKKIGVPTNGYKHASGFKFHFPELGIKIKVKICSVVIIVLRQNDRKIIFAKEMSSSYANGNRYFYFMQLSVIHLHLWIINSNQA